MALIVGWYRASPAHAVRSSPISVGWLAHSVAALPGSGPRLMLSAHNVTAGDGREHLSIELSYKEAESMIDSLRRYMGEHPEGGIIK